MKGSGTDFYRAVLSLRNFEECVQFFHNMLSPGELKKVLNRWEILLLLHQGHPQREIAERLSAGVQTVSRANRLLQEWEDLPEIVKRITQKRGGGNGEKRAKETPSSS